MRHLLTISAVVAAFFLSIQGGRPFTQRNTALAAGAEKTNPANPSKGPSSNAILFRRGPMDTKARRDLDSSADDIVRAEALQPAVATETQIRVVQFLGPVKSAWVHRLTDEGARIIGYIPNNAYLIWADPGQLADIASLDLGEQASEDHPVRWMGHLGPMLKIDPVFGEEALMGPQAQGPQAQTADVEIELLNTSQTAADSEWILSLGAEQLRTPRHFLDFTVLTVSAPVGRLLDIAGLNDVLFVGPTGNPQPLEERGDQILAGNLSADGTMPSAPGYMAWLNSNGFTSPQNFVVDFSDTGLDRGSSQPPMLHPCFLNSSGASRVSYMFNYGDDGEIDDRRGHGTLVASIAGGYPNITTADPQNYLLGLGVAPSMQFGISRIFQSNGSLPVDFSYSGAAAAASAAGAVISNDSWGVLTNAYDSLAQEYDSIVRDAQPSVPGNQEMTFVFASGNFGPGGTVNSPATAKNVIAVGSSQNYRPDSWDTCDFNGQDGIGPAGSDDALDVSVFSSGGPTNDGRAKPDLVAPGCHIYGAESQSPFYNASGICPGFPNYNPTGPQIYTMSSGTSLSTPEITGAAALIEQYFETNDLLRNSAAPSPAMLKAYLVNSCSYLTGQNAGGNLPGKNQGFGLPDLSTAFDDTARMLVDQTTVFTDSGQTYQIQGAVADPTKPLRITLAWTDAPGSLVGAPWVNNLDLELNVNGATYYGNNFLQGTSVAGGSPDSKNNVEAIFLPAGTLESGLAGNFTITVRATNIAGIGVPGTGSVPNQDFALVVYNIGPQFVPPPPVPAISSVTFVKKVLTVTGTNFNSTAQVQINGKTVGLALTFDPTTNALSVKAKAKILGLSKKSPNQVVVVQGPLSSSPFTLQLNTKSST
ncbi:MAG TPA: S8 family serine peptidase [Blastocatellia bacterium]